VQTQHAPGGIRANLTGELSPDKTQSYQLPL
jgi:hypothetical protein